MAFQVVLRTVIFYLTVLIVIRLLGKREVGQLSAFDLVLWMESKYGKLKKNKSDTNWLKDESKKYNVSDFKEVLPATIDSEGNLYVSKKEKP